ENGRTMEFLELYQGAMDLFAGVKDINEQVQSSKNTASNTLKLINDIKSYDTSLKWGKTTLFADLTTGDKKVSSSLRIAQNIFGLRGKVAFVIEGQIVMLYTSIQNQHGNTMTIMGDTTFNEVLDFLDYSIESDTSIKIIWESQARALYLAETHEGFGHVFDKYNYWFKNLLNLFATNQDNDYENAKLFDRLHGYINNLVFYLKSSLKLDSKGKIGTLLKSHFDEYLANDEILNQFPLDKRDAYKTFIESLYKQLTQNFESTNEDKIMEIIEDRLYLTALETIMIKSGIKDRETSITQIMNNIETLLNNPGDLFSLAGEFYFDSAPKQLFLNSMFEVILGSESFDAGSIFITRKMSHIVGYGTERKYLLEVLPNQLVKWFQSIMASFTNDDMKGISEHILDKFAFDPSKNIFGLDFSSVSFYFKKSSRFFDGGGIFDFISFIVSTAIKGSWLESITYDKEFGLVSGLANDGISALIIDVLSNIADGRSIDSLPNRIVQLIAPYAVSYKIGNKFTNSRTLFNVELILDKFFSKDSIDNLGGKLASHEVFLVKLIELVNMELDIIEQAQSVTGYNIKKYIKKIFADSDFQEKVKDLAKPKERSSATYRGSNSIFSSRHFYNQLNEKSAMKDLMNCILNPSNFNKLKTKTASGVFRLSFLFDYNPHFKTGDTIQATDFRLGGRTQILIKEGSEIAVREVKEDTKLATMGPLIVGHSLDANYEGKVILIPLSLLNKINTLNIKEGYKDSNGLIHHGIFVSDNDGIKLDSKLEFTPSTYRIRGKNWQNKLYEYTESRRDSQIIGFKSNFYAAYIFNSGDKYITGLQDTTVILEHIDSTKISLPDYDFGRSARISNQGTIYKPLDPSDYGLSKEDFFKIFYSLFSTDKSYTQLKPQFLTYAMNHFSELNGYFLSERDFLEGDKNGFSLGPDLIDINGIISELGFSEAELQNFIWKDNTGEFLTSQYLKEWLQLAYTKINNYQGTNDNINKEKAKLNAELLKSGYSELDTTVNKEESTNEEAKFAKEIFSSIQSLFGHFTVRLMLFNMIGYYKRGSTFNIKVGKFPSKNLVARFLKNHIRMISPTYQTDSPSLLTTPSRTLDWTNSFIRHIFGLSFSNAHIYLPIIGDHNLKSEKNKLQFPLGMFNFAQQRQRVPNIKSLINT
ncbi:hypothetical protein LCGC14_1569580, partial [marine sediment metagenome]